jgi:carboxypeptidase T
MLLLGSLSLLNAQQGQYSRAKVWLDGRPAEMLGELGIDLLEAAYEPGAFVTDFSIEEMERIRAAGFRIDILIADVQQHYVNQNLERFPDEDPEMAGIRDEQCNKGNRKFNVPARFRYGSMGGYLTLDEALAVMDSMHLAYPNLISARKPIDTTVTHQGRQIFYMKISDNPELQEQEPEVLYNALHHAREPMSLMQLICFMWYLLENYEQDQQIRNLVDHTQLYFIPCLNPDGYEYNRSTNPNGGGLWRKNRRRNSSNSFGVDLNRNYPFKWGHNNSGSSPFTTSETYRGPSPGSEPETKAIMAFCKKHQFVLADNYHTYTNVHILPWGYTDVNCPDSVIFSRFARQLTSENNFTIGRSVATVGYPVNGNSDDWMYGEQTEKPKILAMTPEVGDQADGFWPARSKIYPFCQKQIHSNFMLALLAGRDGQFLHHDSAYANAGLVPVPFSFEQTGLDTTGIYTIRLIPFSSNIISQQEERSFNAPGLFKSFSDTVFYTIAPGVSPSDVVSYVIQIHNGQYLLQSDTIQRLAGKYITRSYQQSTLWSAAGSGNNWGQSQQVYYSAPASFTDSPSGNYGTNRNQAITLTEMIDLRAASDAVFRFYARWYFEFGFDHAQVEASVDNGQNWTALCGKYTIPGSGTFQSPGSPLYTSLQEEWVLEEMSLNDFLGSEVTLRFRIRTNGSVNRDGFYFDDPHVQLLVPEITGLKQAVAENSALHVFPNPLKTGERLYLNAFANAQVRLYDTTGKIVAINKTDHMGSLEVPSLNGGIYLISVSDDSGNQQFGKLNILP